MTSSMKVRLFFLVIFTFFFLFLITCKHSNDSKNISDMPSKTESKKVWIKSIKVNGCKIKIEKDIDLKKTKANHLVIDCDVAPYDAELEFFPALSNSNEKGGTWELGNEVGKKYLRITVKKTGEENVYNLMIEKQSEDALCINKIMCEDESLEQDDIFSTISFGSIAKAYANIKIEPSNPLATVEFSGYGESSGNASWKWFLASGDNNLYVKLTHGEKTEEYTINLQSSLPAVGVNYSLNGNYNFKLPDEFDEKSTKGENPLFDANCNHLFMGFWTQLEIEKIIVVAGRNKMEAPIPIGLTAKTSKQLFMLEEGEQQFELFIIPKEFIMTKVACLHSKFRVKGNTNKFKQKPMLLINGNNELPSEFLSNLDTEVRPIYRLFKGPAHLYIQMNSYANIRIIKEVKINDEKVPFTPENSSVVQKKLSLKLEEPTHVKVEFIPVDENAFEITTWNFSLQLGGEKPPVFGVQLLGINDVGMLGEDLPESLTQHLKDESNPLYEYDGKYANVVLKIKNWYIVKNAHFRIDGGAGKLETIITKGKDAYLKHTYEITDDEAHNIEIVVHPKNTREYIDLVLKFQLKRTGNKIKMPTNAFNFTINKVPDLKMPDDVRKHLTDGSNPLYEIDGFDVHASILTFSELLSKRIKNVIFTFDGYQPQIFPFKKNPEGTFDNWMARTNFTIEEGRKAHLLTIELIPRDKEIYEGLIFSIKIESNGYKIPMPLLFGINNKVKKDGTHIKINNESATILVQSGELDLMKSVNISIKGVDDVECPITKNTSSKGAVFYDARRVINLLDGNNTPKRTIIIKVIPKAPNKYLKTICTYYITGTKIEKDNAKFIFENEKPKVDVQVEFHPRITARYFDDYGTTHASFKAYTENQKASVRYAILNRNNEMIDFPTGTTPTEKYKTLINNNGEHHCENIKLFENKPTIIKLWVVAEDGYTEDEAYGIYIVELNPIALRWSYDKKEATTSRFDDFENVAYDEIKIEKNKIKDDDKNIYIAVRVWYDGPDGFDIKNIAEQGNFTKLVLTGTENATYKQSYMLKFDVSKLKDGIENELTFKCNMWNKGLTTDCFTYVVKIKADD